MSSKYSYSGISLYQTCPRQYEYANIKKLPRSISAGESFGTSVHSVMAKWGNMEMDNVRCTMDDGGSQMNFFGDDLEDHVVAELHLETLLQLWNESFSVYGYDSKSDVDAARIRGQQCMTHIFDWWKCKKRDVFAVEKGFSIVLGDRKITGRFDRIEKSEQGLHIIDFKSGKVRGQESIDSDLQLSLYALAAREMYPEIPVTDLSLLFTREDGCTEISTQRSAENLLSAQQELQESIGGIEGGLFAATPTEYICGKCPYRRVCPSATIPA